MSSHLVVRNFHLRFLYQSLNYYYFHSLGEWPSVFYISGGVGIIWCLVWFLWITEYPTDEYSTETTSLVDRNNSDRIREVSENVPWKKVLMSLPVWSNAVGVFCQDWIWFFIITEHPSYFDNVLDIHITDNGLYSSLPIIAAFLSQLVSGCISDYLLHIKSWRKVNVRRFLVIIGFLPSSVLLLICSPTEKGNTPQAVALMTCCAATLRLTRVSFVSNVIDLTQTFTAVVYGIVTMIAVTSGIAAPLMTGLLTDGGPTPENYQKVFIVNASICLCGCLFFVVFVSADTQD